MLCDFIEVGEEVTFGALDAVGNSSHPLKVLTTKEKDKWKKADNTPGDACVDEIDKYQCTCQLYDAYHKSRYLTYK
ncbi:Uncharacterised protein [Chlamydia trachomatis]|nr:Uncharacterised protein [Chlamydia trachomatis]